MEELLILQETEFQVLAALLEFADIYGVRPGKEPNEADIMYTIHTMVKKGILVEKEKRFQISEPYRNIVLSMKEAKWILAVTGMEEQVGNVCFYLGDKIVSLEESIQDNSAFKLGSFEVESFYMQLSDRGFLPKTFWDEDITRMQQEEMYAGGKKVYAKYLLFPTTKVGEEPYKSFYLLQNACGYRLKEKGQEEVRLLPYDAWEFYRILAGICGIDVPKWERRENDTGRCNGTQYGTGL